MEKVEMNLVLAVCKQSLQREILQGQISVFSYKHQGEGGMKVISFESVRQAALMQVRKSKVLNKYESNSDWLNGSWKEEKNMGRELLQRQLGKQFKPTCIMMSLYCVEREAS